MFIDFEDVKEIADCEQDTAVMSSSRVIYATWNESVNAKLPAKSTHSVNSGRGLTFSRMP